MSLALAGATVGFLRYNFNPAKIFMGDTGSMLLGYTLAAISVMGAVKTAATIALVVPAIVLGLPIWIHYLLLYAVKLAVVQFLSPIKAMCIIVC